MIDKSVKEFVEEPKLPKIARRLRHRVEEELQWSRAKYHEKCLEAAGELAELYPQRHPKIDDVPQSRIDQLFALAHHAEVPATARAMHKKKLEVLAHAAGISIEDLLFDDESNFVLADPQLDSEIRARVGRYLQHYESLTGELIAMAGFLPCSLETDAFMRAHHETLFAHLEPDAKAVVIDTYNNIGSMRAKRLLTAERIKTASMTHVMLDSDLVAIAEGRDVYSGINPAVRRDCLVKLHRIISDPTHRVSLIVGEDNAHPTAKSLLKTYDTVLVFKHEFAIGRLHNTGTFKLSANTGWIRKIRMPIDELIQTARWREPETVLQRLQLLIDSIKHAD